MARTLLAALGAVLILGGAGGYWWFLGPRTKTVEGYVGPANSAGIKAYVRSEIALDGLTAGLGDRVFRLRYWDINPGGIVPIHSHRGRPATIYVVNSAVGEFRNGASQPILHRGGEISVESEGLVHHWRNDTEETVHLVATDIYRGAAPARAAAESVRRFEPLGDPSAVREDVLALLNLAEELPGAEGLGLRTRRITLEPGGETPVSVVDAGPLNVFVLQGAVMERRTDATADIALSEGVVTDALPGVSIAWRNAADAPAVLLVSDMIPFGPRDREIDPQAIFVEPSTR